MTLQRFQGAPFLDHSFPLPLDAPFHRHQALREGVPPRWLSALVATGHLRRPLRGVYIAAQAPDTLAVRIASLRLVTPSDAVVADRHAGWVHGASMVLAPNEHLEARPLRMARYPGTNRIQRHSVDSFQRTLLAEDVVELDGLLVTTPLRTALDLGRVRHRFHAMAGIDAMLRVGVDKEELLGGIERFRAERWVTTLRSVGPAGDARSASPPESACKLVWRDVTGELPELQIRVSGPAGNAYFLDLGCTAARFAIEYDGVEWHTSAPDQVRDQVRRAHIADRHGYLIEVVRAENVYGDHPNLDRLIRAGLTAARRRRALSAH